MKKNILSLLILLVFSIATESQAQDWCAKDLCCNEDCCDSEACFNETSFNETSFYAKILGGVNFLQETIITENKATYQPGYIISGSLGYCWLYGLRLEAEYAFRRSDISRIDFFVEGFSHDGHYQVSSYMANLFWDLPLCPFWNIQPFVGAGIGYDFHRMHASNSRIIFDQKWKHFSWQLMAGLAYPIFCNTDIALEYIFHQGGCRFYNHSLGVGFVYKFGCLR